MKEKDVSCSETFRIFEKITEEQSERQWQRQQKKTTNGMEMKTFQFRPYEFYELKDILKIVISSF